MLSGLQKATSDAAMSAKIADLELLAHYERLDAAQGVSRSGFALLIELSEQKVLLETDVAFDDGDELNLNFFLPDAGVDAGRTKVSLRCTVVHCRSRDHLHFAARVSKLGEASRTAIQRLQTGSRSGP